MGLPRVRKTLGALRGLAPESLLDVGSGRGAFLWPLLDAFPDLQQVTTLDLLAYRVTDMEAVRTGGVWRLHPVLGDATAMPFEDRASDGVTALEVLEHIPDARRALAEVCRVAQRFVIVSCPSRPDDNPDHIHLFDPHDLTRQFTAQGFARVTTEQVLNHVILVARRSAP
jgi:ubiquinone/menaquinone biosynthesis C-methylase UbiE